MKVELWPYVLIDGVPSLRDSQLGALYARMAADQTLAVMNYEGQLNDAAQFIAAAKAAAYFALVRRDGAEVAVVWLNRYELRRAHLHFCVFAEAWGAGSVALGRAVMERLINLRGPQGAFSLDVIWGVIPQSNINAARYVQHCGGKLCAPIPNYVWCAERQRCEPGVVFYYTRNEED